MKWKPFFNTQAESDAARLLKEKRMAKWHQWFAWYPVRTINNNMVWMEHVFRRGRRSYVMFTGWKCEYNETVFDLLKMDSLEPWP